MNHQVRKCWVQYFAHTDFSCCGKDSWPNNLLHDMNLDVSIESIIAMSVFAEILSFEIIAGNSISRKLA